jgi:catecholate siderophore receptor
MALPKRIVLLFFILPSALWLAPGLAQTTSPSPTPAKGDTSNELNQVVVTGAQIPLNEAIVPTVRPTDSVFGLDQNVMDIPRNITIISRAQLDDISITDVRDFTKLTTSSYTTSNFGEPSNPSIRGQIADIFINGMRQGLTEAGAGLPLDFNYVESVDIFKGPPTVLSGTSQNVGGWVNLDTKQPFFDAWHGSVSSTFGDYGVYRWTIDTGGPLIANQLAFRVSYSGDYSNSFVEGQYFHTQSLYAALTWTPSSNYTLQLMGDAYFASYTQNFGYNRPTQELIDNYQYYSGFVHTPTGQLGTAANVFPGTNFIYPTGYVTLPLSDRLDIGDIFYGNYYWGQAIQKLELNDTATLVNNTLFQYKEDNLHTLVYWSEVIAPAISFENRTELHLNFDVPIGGTGVTADGKRVADDDGKSPLPGITPAAKPFVIGNQINLGLDVRYQEVTAYDDFDNEPANAWDISRQYLYGFDPNNFGAGTALPVPGHPGYTATPGVLNGDTNNSRILDIGPFYQHVFNIGDHFSILAGARADIIGVTVMDPLYDEAKAAGIALPVSTNKATAWVVDPNFNVSPTFKPWKWLTLYFTYNYSESIASGDSGGFPGNAIPIPIKEDLKQVSELYEAGAKLSLVQDTLFINTAVFNQSRNLPQIGGATIRDKTQGFEIEADYQPNRNFYLSAGYSYLNSFEFVPRGGTFLATQQYPVNYPQQSGVLFGGPPGSVAVDTGYFAPEGAYRQPGLPSHLFNFLAKYQIPTSYGTFGAVLGVNVTGPYFLDYNGYIIVPWQYEMDLSFLYKSKNDRVEARLALLNLTDQKNWSPPNPFYGNDSVVAEWPFHVEATITFKF